MKSAAFINFINALQGNNLLSQKESDNIISSLNNFSSLEELAQHVLDFKTDGLSFEEAESILIGIQNILEKLPLIDDFVSGDDSIIEKSYSFDGNIDNNLRIILRNLADSGASDLHISAGSPMFVRESGTIKKLNGDVVSEELSKSMNLQFLEDSQLEEFLNKKSITYPLGFDNNERYRASLIFHKDGIAGTYHILSQKIKELPELGFTESNVKVINSLLDHHNGLILIAGPMGSGKTTTLASLINILNKERTDHIIVIEDPIEIVHKSINCNITQRQVGSHTKSYAAAIKAALREDPDIIVIGELSDLETIKIAITASETGHLVIGTMKTSDSINTLNRMINSFPPFQQPQIRAMLAGSLRGIICQKLIKGVDGKQKMACELMVNYTAVGNVINDGSTHMLKQIIQTGTKQGMCTLDSSVIQLYESNKISRETALDNISDKKYYESVLKK